MKDDTYDRLCAWSLGLGDADFVHQHVVDARMLQTADTRTKPIGVAFAAAGLFLFLERGLSGREVQRAHVKMGAIGGPWPHFPLPAERGDLGPADVLAATGRDERVAAIRRWCVSVWAPWSEQRTDVLSFLQRYRVLP